MRNKIKVKLTSLLTVLAMVVTMLPVGVMSVFAETIPAATTAKVAVPGAKTYTKATKIENGANYVIVANYRAMSSYSSGYNRSSTSVDIDGNNITSDVSSDIVWTFTGSGDSWQISNGNNNLIFNYDKYEGLLESYEYYSLSTTSNDNEVTVKKNNDNTFIISDSVNNTTKYVQYNNRNFRARDNGTNLTLYKEVETQATTQDYGVTIKDSENKDIEGRTLTINDITENSTYQLNSNYDESIFNDVKWSIESGSEASINENTGELSFTGNTGEVIVKVTATVKEGLNASPSTATNYIKVSFAKYKEPTAEDIKVDKNAKAVEGKKDTYNVKLDVIGAEVKSGNPVDVVLVLDNSTSMNESKRRANTVTAAESFAKNVLTPDNNGTIKISVVRYGTKASIAQFTSNSVSWNTEYSDSLSLSNASTYSDNLTLVNKAIDDGIGNVDNNQGTNTEAGLLTANKAVGARRANAKSIVIFMTDGLPTYSYNKNNGYQGPGGSTYKREFNNALTAGINLKSNYENIDIYNVGLLNGLSNNELKLAENLLGANPKKYTGSYTDKELANRVDYTSEWSNATSYASNYYKIDSKTTNVAETLKDVYNEIAVKAKALAKGTVTDNIPATFRLTSESKANLEQNGVTVTEIIENGEYKGTTLVYSDISAGKEKANNLYEYTVVAEPGAYGAAYTNTGAVYEYTLNTSTGGTGTKNFPQPVAPIHPIAVGDEDSTGVNTDLLLDKLLENDKDKYGVKYNEGGTSVTDVQLVLCNEKGEELTSEDGKYTLYDGNVTLTQDGNSITFNSKTEGDKVFYYKLKVVVSNTNDKYAQGAETVLYSEVVPVTVHVYDLSNKVFVIDYGKAVTYGKDDLFSSTEQGLPNGNITLDTDKTTHNYGSMVYSQDNKSLTYTLDRFMNGKDVAVLNVKFDSKVTLPKTVTVLPATTVYYEDNFGSSGKPDKGTTGDTTAGIIFNESSVIETVGESKDNQQGTGNSEYGYDSSYESDSTDSNGSSTKISGDGTAKATFTFTGKGFDIIGRTSTETGAILIKIYRGNQATTENFIEKRLVDTKYSDGEIYQIPVFNYMAEEHGTYTVEITIGKSNAFYLDAIRIYNPIDVTDTENADSAIAKDAYDKALESNAQITEIRNELITSGTFKSDGTGAVYVDGSTDKDSADMAEYKSIGPNNEVYLKPGQSIGFEVDNLQDIATIQIGAKAPNGKVTFTAGSGTSGLTKELNTATDMYYTLYNKDREDNYVTINNNKAYIIITNTNSVDDKASDDQYILSLTNIKLTYTKATTGSKMLANESVLALTRQVTYARMASLEPNLEIAKAEFTTSSVKQTKDATLKVYTTKDVEDLIITDKNGNKVTPKSITSVVDEGAEEASQKVFTVVITENTVGTSTYSIVGVGANNNQSKEAVSASIKVQRLTIFDKIASWFE